MSHSHRYLWLTTAALAAVVSLLYAPVLSFELIGDDFQWVQLAHRAQLSHRLLFADLDSFYRPLNTWSLLLDRTLWGNTAAGYHGTNLVLHVLSALAIAVAARRLGLGRAAAAAIALIWSVSPFAEEPAAWVSARFQSFLTIGWMGLLAVWPQRDERWTARRRLGVLGFLALAAAAKESWVVMPFAGLMLEYRRTGGDLLRTLRTVLPFLLLPIVYVVAYFTAFPGDKDYFSGDLAVLSKLPHMFAAFFHFQELVPLQFPWNWQAGVASLLLLAVLAYGYALRSLAALAATACLGLSVLPELLIPYLPTRHTTLPYAAFLLLMAAVVEQLARQLPDGYRRRVGAAGAAFLLLPVVAGAATVRADLVDYRRVSDATAHLIAEAKTVQSEFRPERAVIIVRDENINPLAEVAKSPHGRLKLWYPRHEDPYGLVDAAALFDWSLGLEGDVVRRVDVGDWEETLGVVSGVLLLHRAGGFARAPYAVDDVASEARHWKESGRRFRIVMIDSRAGRERSSALNATAASGS